MEISIRARGVDRSDNLTQMLQRSIAFAVDRHKSRINRISVYLEDVNGPRGGVDKHCQIEADLRGAQSVMILEKGDDLMAVANRAVRRLGYRIGRHIDRGRVAGAPEHRRTIRAA
jgi:hypothetical protein